MIFLEPWVSLWEDLEPWGSKVGGVSVALEFTMEVRIFLETSPGGVGRSLGP